MTIHLIVIRGAGDKEGTDILDPLLCSTAAALGRGAQEIDASTPVNAVSLEITYRVGLRKGMVVEVVDSVSSETWQGTIMSMTHVIEGATIYSKLDIERPI